MPMQPKTSLSKRASHVARPARYDGMTEEQIAAVDPRFGADRMVDKLATRYPHGQEGKPSGKFRLTLS